MKDAFEILFHIVTTLIGVYAISHYLTSINLQDKKLRKLYVSGNLDTNAIFYSFIYFGTSFIFFMLTYFDLIDLSQKVLDVIPVTAVISLGLTMITVIISTICFHKCKKGFKGLPTFVIAINGITSGLVINTAIKTFTAEKTLSLLCIAIIALQALTAHLFVGRSRRLEVITINMYFRNEDLVKQLSSAEDTTPYKITTSGLFKLKVQLIEEKDDYCIEISNKNFRIPKDEVLLIEEF